MKKVRKRKKNPDTAIGSVFAHGAVGYLGWLSATASNYGLNKLWAKTDFGKKHPQWTTVINDVVNLGVTYGISRYTSKKIKKRKSLLTAAVTGVAIKTGLSMIDAFIPSSSGGTKARRMIGLNTKALPTPATPPKPGTPPKPNTPNPTGQQRRPTRMLINANKPAKPVGQLPQQQQQAVSKVWAGLAADIAAAAAIGPIAITVPLPVVWVTDKSAFLDPLSGKTVIAEVYEPFTQIGDETVAGLRDVATGRALVDGMQRAWMATLSGKVIMQDHDGYFGTREDLLRVVAGVAGSLANLPGMAGLPPAGYQVNGLPPAGYQVDGYLNGYLNGKRRRNPYGTFL